ncbi:putative RNase H-like nuclease [Frondihabitans sp. PhB188]|uniref:DUF429 domain-containing protein n=1 Tax=Frondihabitans sp. PhB188 TaxID=2485200 RepID=UPI000F46D34B|nr:DUF429 domain-containing protein [Frondihabitans sp. PhB188]ROQ39789.1 putative RNase H-like nuclease [Frondihabitans sp. PhB188]
MLLIGVDLAWGEGSPARPASTTGPATRARLANETGVCAMQPDGTIVDAGWTRGVDATAEWILRHTGAGAVIAVDAPLVVPNATGMRESEKQVGRAYGRWKVSCNATNQALPWLAGLRLRDLLDEHGVTVVAGTSPPADGARVAFECYPFTTLVGMSELGYDVERPRYKRLDRALPPAEARLARRAATDDLIGRLARLDAADPPVDLRSHPLTADLLESPTPLDGPGHKHREDLIDAVLCAWTASVWLRHGLDRTQVLGRDEPLDEAGRPATIVTPCRPTQRLL